MLNVLDSLEYNIQSLTSMGEKTNILSGSKDTIEKEIVHLNDEIKLINDSKEYYTKAIDILYQESLGALKDTLNMAIKYVMYDKNYAVDLVLEDKRGTKTLDIRVVDEDTGLAVGIKRGCGQGLRTIISCVLKVYYLLNQNSKILFLDEKYSTLSSSYVQKFFEFVTELTKEKGMILIMITHDERFMVYGNKTYMINDGHLVNSKNVEEVASCLE